MTAWRIMLLALGGLLTCALVAPAQTAAPAERGAPEARKPKVEGARVHDGQRAQQTAVETWLKGLKERNPEEFERLTKLREENPEAFQKTLRERLEKVHAGGLAAKWREEAQKRHPELAKQEAESHKLIEAYKAASPEEKKQLRAELKKKLGELFELREKSRQETIQRMESQLAQLRKDADKRKASRDAIIEHHLKELTEEDPLAW